MSKKKKKTGKNKAPMQNAPLAERLAKHWELGRWEAFLSLYDRNREASTATCWGTSLGDALYNALTQALFVDRSIANARFAAERMLGEKNLGPDAETLRCCAALTLEYASVRAGSSVSLTPLPKGLALPEPYDRLHRGMAEILAAKASEDETEASALVKKLRRQFSAFRPGIGLTPYTNFWKIACELENLMQGTPGAGTFTAVRAIAELLREVNRAESRSAGSRNIEEFARSQAFGEIPPDQTHPVVIGLWGYLCEAGGVRYGPEWAAAARTLQIRFVAGLEKFKAAYDVLIAIHMGSVEIDALLGKFPWTEAERFILLLTEAPMFCTEMAGYEADTTRRAVRFFERISEIGARWRPERPWPDAVRSAFSQTVQRDGYTLAEILTKKRMPYRSMHTCDLLFFVINEPVLRKQIETALAGHLPLPLSGEWVEETAEMLAACEVSAANLRRIARFLSDDAYRSLLSAWVDELVSISAGDAVEEFLSTLSSWAAITDEHLAVVCKNLPEESAEGCFCRLCLAAGPFKISSDSDVQEALLKALPGAEARFRINLLILLTSWREVPLSFWLRLLEAAIPPQTGQMEMLDWCDWLDLASVIGDRDDGTAMATKLVSRLEKIPKRERLSTYKRVLSLFKKLVKGEKKRTTKENTPFDISDFDADMMEQLKQMAAKMMKRMSPKYSKEAQSRSLFEDFEDDELPTERR